LNYFENNKIILVEGDDNLKTGDRIKELRKISNLTQLELAKKLNITDKAISKWESNLGEPSIEMLLQLSKLFDVSID
jgi:transcriptional regulator with XRE-family HTH domain